jgi:hypothetical protein
MNQTCGPRADRPPRVESQEIRDSCSSTAESRPSGSAVSRRAPRRRSRPRARGRTRAGACPPRFPLESCRRGDRRIACPEAGRPRGIGRKVPLPVFIAELGQLLRAGGSRRSCRRRAGHHEHPNGENGERSKGTDHGEAPPERGGWARPKIKGTFVFGVRLTGREAVRRVPERSDDSNEASIMMPRAQPRPPSRGWQENP